MIGKRETIKNWDGKIIGSIETDSITGDKLVKNFYGRILGRYIKRLDLTRDFYGRTIGRGDQSMRLLTLNNK